MRNIKICLALVGLLTGSSTTAQRPGIPSGVSTEDGSAHWQKRMENVLDVFQPEEETACLESQIASIETDLEKMKSRADSRARGYVGEFRNVLPRMSVMRHVKI